MRVATYYKGDLVIVPVLFAASMILIPAPVADTPPIPLIGQAAAQAEQERQEFLERPGRGSSRAVIIVERAATFPDNIKSWAACVLDRESGGTLTERQSGVGARNPSSSASGRWQFLNNAWNDSLPYMVADRLVDFGMPRPQARMIREHLQSIPIYEWHGYWQDIGFLEVVARGGRHHWDGPGC